MARNLSSVIPLLADVGPFNDVPEEYNAAEAMAALQKTKILVIGAGGLGCEILKDLVLTGFKAIHIIDMDTIDVSNLNRQFLFRAKDVGKPKAKTAAESVMARVQDPSLEIVAHNCRIQDMPPGFYAEFSVVVCGLDNVEARRWINALLVGFAGSELSNIIPLVDGGTEGFRGQSRVILPMLTSCFECSLDMLSPKVTYPVCTIANTPRLPEHCIEWASQLEWPRRYPGRKFDADNPTDVDDMYALSLERAEEFGIEQVSRSLTLGVVKNIIPAIASTNAIIAASCSNEVFKIATSCNPILDNYMMYSGDDSIFTYTYAHSKRPSCPVCGTSVKRIKARRWWTVRHLLHMLQSEQELMLSGPSVATSKTNIYMTQPVFLHEQTKSNLSRRLSDLVAAGEEMVVTDRNLPISVRLVIESYDGPEDEPEDVSSLLKSQH